MSQSALAPTLYQTTLVDDSTPPFAVLIIDDQSSAREILAALRSPRFSTNVEQLENRGYRPTANWYEKHMRICLYCNLVLFPGD